MKKIKSFYSQCAVKLNAHIEKTVGEPVTPKEGEVGLPMKTSEFARNFTVGLALFVAAIACSLLK